MGLKAERPRLATLCMYLSAISVGCPALAAAQSSSPAAIEQHAVPGFLLGLKLGLGSGRIFSSFGARYGFEIEAGYLLPLPAPLLHSLELFVTGGYERTSSAGKTSEPDARLPGDGFATYRIREQSVPWGAGLRWRVPLPSARLAPYLAVGYRAAATTDTIQTRVAGHAVEDNTERALLHGVFASAGLELFVGPGAVLAEFHVSRAARSEYVLRDAAVGGMQAYLGYRLMFGSRAATEPRQTTKPAQRQPTAPEPAPAAPAPVESLPVAAEDTVPGAAAEPTPVAPDVPLSSQIRGNVRSFDGMPVRATVLVEPGALRAASGDDGKFSLDAAPGRYTVTVMAPGYATQKHTCAVDAAGITVLNVELRDE